MRTPQKLCFFFIFVLLFSGIQEDVFAEDEYKGIPIYPEAEETESSKNLGKSQMNMIADIKSFETPDSFEDVVSFYKEEFPDVDPTQMEVGEMKMAVFVIEKENDRISLSVKYNQNKEITTITIMDYKDDNF